MGLLSVRTLAITLFLAQFSVLPIFSPRALAFTPHAPISIDGDSGFTPGNGVTGGSGTPSDPFIIEGWDIDVTTIYGIGIFVQNTQAHFVVRNVYIHSSVGGAASSQGIVFHQVMNGSIQDSEITEQRLGVNLRYYSRDIRVTGNFIHQIAGLSVNVWNVDSFTLDGNTFSNNSMGALLSQGVTNGVVSNNSFTNDGMYLGGRKVEEETSNVIAPDNLVNGLPLYFYKNCANLTVDNVPVGQLLIVNCTNVRVSDIVIGNTATGIEMRWVNNATVYNSTVTFNNLAAIDFYKCLGCTVSGNNLSSNHEGIHLWESHDSSISGNILLHNIDSGIVAHYSDNVTIVNNTAKFNGLFETTMQDHMSGIFLDGAKGTITGNILENNSIGIYNNVFRLSNNTVTGNKLGMTLGIGAGSYVAHNKVTGNGNGSRFLCGCFVQVSSWPGCSVLDNDFSGNIGWGVYIIAAGSSNMSSRFLFSNNTISNNSIGVIVTPYPSPYYPSGHVNFTYNRILDNGLGISLNSAANVTLHHNNFIDNVVQAADDLGPENSWDSGYPSGGNYWSDYTGVDQYSGPNQDIPGPDGIGDSPREIDANSKDRYPLMRPPVRLTPGHHLMSFPVMVANRSIESVLSSISGCYDHVRWYDPLDPASHWKSYSPGRAYNSLLVLDNTMGFWINVTAACAFTPAGARPSVTTLTLHQGWNMVGFPSFNTSYTVADLKADIGLAGIVVEAFDSKAPPYHLQRISDSYVMAAGEGYWVYVPSDATWNIQG